MNLDKPTYIIAIKSLVGGNIGGYNDGPIEKIKFFDGQTPPSEEEIQAKIQELQAAEPLRQLREQRNQLLASTDWRMTSDYPYSDQAQWASYRTSLRNLPATSEPTLSESEELIVNWPTAPDAA